MVLRFDVRQTLDAILAQTAPLFPAYSVTMHMSQLLFGRFVNFLAEEAN